MTRFECLAAAGLIAVYVLAGFIEPCDGYDCKGIAMDDDNQDFWHQQQQQEEQQQYEEQHNAK